MRVLFVDKAGVGLLGEGVVECVTMSLTEFCCRSLPEEDDGFVWSFLSVPNKLEAKCG